MDWAAWFFVAAVVILAVGNVCQYYWNKGLWKTNRELVEIAETEFRVSREAVTIVNHSFATLYHLSKIPGGMEQGTHWDSMSTAYGTMRIWIHRPDHRRLAKGKR